MTRSKNAAPRTHSRHGSTDVRPGRVSRGLTCANCRSRKTRCDGTQPGCKTCEVYKDKCRYEKPPPMSQIIAMAKKLQDTEETVARLQRAIEALTEARGIPPGQSPGWEEATSARSAEDSPATALLDDTQAEDGSSTQVSMDNAQGHEKPFSDLSLDGNGKLCYHGPTSAVHDPATLETQSANSPDYDEQSSKTDARLLLTSNALESKTWEGFALGNAAVQTDIPRDMITRLLQVHWTWISPMFMWVYRPAFMRDMAVGGPSYSPFLLIVMCAHASRFDQSRLGEILISRARLLLGNEIHRPSCIPTVQALLQLSARDLAYGSISQAWLYSGMAFRMVSDLGLHHSTAKMNMLGHLSAEDLEIHRRLFWSCYFWDKAISVYLGRMPVLPELPFDRSPELLDDSAEHDIWSPYHEDKMNLSRMSFGEYPPMESHTISCFENSCRLAVILNDIIHSLYSRRPTANMHETLRGIKFRLGKWREESPSFLKYNPDDLPDICPPPHILTQNLLYYTAVILLHRPFYSIAAHHTACRQASDNIEKLVLLLEKTFGFSRITYLMAYCVYTAASAMLQDVKSGDIEASTKMQTFLHALRQGTTTCPVIQRSLDIITNGLRSQPSRASSRISHNNAAQQSLGPRNYLPAFPYRDLENEFGGNMASSSMDLDGFSLLDCFPENQFDNTGASGEWFFEI